MASPGSSRSSSCASFSDETIVVVTADGGRPSVGWKAPHGIPVVYADARRRALWPILAELDVALDALPCAYVVRASSDWFDRPGPLRPSRRVHFRIQ